MNTRNGIVMKTENSTIYLMTSDGEFVKVRLDNKGPLPMIGSEYCGEIIKPSFLRSNILKYAPVACLTLFTLLGGSGAYAYYKPVSTITINTNSSIELKSNTWGKVVSATPINEDGKKILQEISLKNKAVDDALILVLDQSKKDKFIDDNYVKNNTVQISIKGKELDLSSFKKKISEDTLSVKIDNNGTVIYDKNLKTQSGVSSDNKKDIKNTSKNPTSDMDKNTTNSNVVNDDSPVKNEDKHKSENSNSPNKNTLDDKNSHKNNTLDNKNSDKNKTLDNENSDKNKTLDNENSDDISYYLNWKFSYGRIHKKHNNNKNSDTNSIKKNDKDTEKSNTKNFNNNGHNSKNKDKND